MKTRMNDCIKSNNIQRLQQLFVPYTNLKIKVAYVTSLIQFQLAVKASDNTQLKLRLRGI